MANLQVDVHVSSQEPVSSALAVPFNRAEETTILWSPISCTLIRGEKEAVLVDTPISIGQTETLVTWIESLLGDRRLTYLYVTHGHADHWFGISLLKRRFPGLRAIATQGTVEHMRQQVEPAYFQNVWAAFFPNEGQLPKDIEIAEPLSSSNEFELEGHVLRAVEVGHTDTHSTTFLHVPALELAVCGDVVYGDVHQMLRTANTKEKRHEWIQAVETLKRLQPKIVIAGHKRPGGADSPALLDTTISYLRDYDAFVDQGPADSRLLYDRMMEKYGGRLNPMVLEMGVHAAFPPSD